MKSNEKPADSGFYLFFQPLLMPARFEMKDFLLKFSVNIVSTGNIVAF